MVLSSSNCVATNTLYTHIHITHAHSFAAQKPNIFADAKLINHVNILAKTVNRKRLSQCAVNKCSPNAKLQNKTHKHANTHTHENQDKITGT